MSLGSEEHVLRDVKHPAHTSGGREGMAAGLVVWGISVVFVGLTDYSATIDTFIVVFGTIPGAAAWYYVTKWIGGIAARNKAKTEAEYRETMEVETRQKLAEARASGAFNNWEAKA